MRRKTDLPELLSPAGSMECLVAALEAGADAVYIGGKKFGARAYAKNFDIDEISTDNIQLYVDSMKGFLSSLLYYGDLVSEISKINLTLESNLTVSVTNDIQKYKEFTVTELEV